MDTQAGGWVIRCVEATWYSDGYQADMPRKVWLASTADGRVCGVDLRDDARIQQGLEVTDEGRGNPLIRIKHGWSAGELVGHVDADDAYAWDADLKLLRPDGASGETGYRLSDDDPSILWRAHPKNR